MHCFSKQLSGIRSWQRIKQIVWYFRESKQLFESTIFLLSDLNRPQRIIKLVSNNFPETIFHQSEGRLRRIKEIVSRNCSSKQFSGIRFPPRIKEIVWHSREPKQFIRIKNSYVSRFRPLTFRNLIFISKHPVPFVN